MSLFPDVHFGPCDETIDWRECVDDSPDDDAELAVTPPDVVGILGFDPLELKGEAHLEWLPTSPRLIAAAKEGKQAQRKRAKGLHR
jgi:hypothetical protein